MTQVEKKATRKSGRHLRVPVLEEEAALIEANAKQVGLSTAAFLRQVGMGYEVHGILDQARVNDLAKVNGDLGRLGGLLKLWLTNDERVAAFNINTILKLLEKIEETQDELRDVMRQVVKR